MEELPGDDLPIAAMPAAVSFEPLPKTGTQQTAKRAIAMLVAMDLGFHEPSRKERRALLVAFAMSGKVLYGAAFDIVRATRPVDFENTADITRNMNAISIYEVKSTNRADIGPDLKNYFFALSTAELLVAQSLGKQFRFAFVNTVSESFIEMGLQNVFARARGIYPTWSIRF